jgi:hypothetical protein
MGFWIGIVVCHREYEYEMSRLLIKHDGEARGSNAFGDSGWNLNSGSIMRHCQDEIRYLCRSPWQLEGS